MNKLSKFFLALLAALIATGSALSADCSDQKPLRFAAYPKKDIDIQLKEYRPLIQLLEKSLARRVELVRTTSYGSAVEGLVAGSIDLAELGPAAYAMAKSRDSGITAFASSMPIKGTFTDSTSHYRSLLIVKRNGGFDTIAALRGAHVSLIDPASTSGALIPRKAILDLTGARLEEYFNRVTFAGAHDRAIQSVQKGIVDAAFVSSLRLDEALRQHSLSPEEIRVLWQSKPVPHDPFVYRGQLCANVVNAIKADFFEKDSVLQGMFRDMNISGFARVSDDDYREIREVFASQR